MAGHVMAFPRHHRSPKWTEKPRHAPRAGLLLVKAAPTKHPPVWNMVRAAEVRAWKIMPVLWPTEWDHERGLLAARPARSLSWSYITSDYFP